MSLKLDNSYTLQIPHTTSLFTIPEDRIMSYDPNSTPHDILQDLATSLLNWIKLNVVATFVTPTMTKPRHGSLALHTDGKWYFLCDRGNT